MAPRKKSYGSSSGRTYKTTGRPGSYKRMSFTTYRGKKKSKVSVFADTGSAPELKNLDVAIAATSFSLVNTWNITNASVVAAGTGVGQRVGRKVRWKSFQYRCNGSVVNELRVLTIYDRQPNGVQAATLDVLTQDSWNSPMNLNNSDRFLVLDDSYYSPATQGAGASTYGSKFKKISLDSIYDPAVAIPQSGHIFMMIATIAAGATSTFQIFSRGRFIDN